MHVSRRSGHIPPLVSLGGLFTAIFLSLPFVRFQHGGLAAISHVALLASATVRASEPSRRCAQTAGLLNQGIDGVDQEGVPLWERHQHYLQETRDTAVAGGRILSRFPSFTPTPALFSSLDALFLFRSRELLSNITGNRVERGSNCCYCTDRQGKTAALSTTLIVFLQHCPAQSQATNRRSCYSIRHYRLRIAFVDPKPKHREKSEEKTCSARSQ